MAMINVSETAASKISELLVEEQKTGGGLRVFVQGGGCSGFQYGMMIEENGQGAGDQVFEAHGIKLFVDPISLQYLKNAEVDFVDTITGGGFTIKNPNAKSTCGCGSSFSTEETRPSDRGNPQIRRDRDNRLPTAPRFLDGRLGRVHRVLNARLLLVLHLGLGRRPDLDD